MTEVRGRDQRGALVGTGDEIGAIAEIQGQRDQGWVVGAAALHGDRDRRAETIGSLFWTAPETEMRKVRLRTETRSSELSRPKSSGRGTPRISILADVSGGAEFGRTPKTVW